MISRVVIFGTSGFGIPSFDSVLGDLRLKIKVVGVVTQPAKPTGRHQELVETPVAGWAEEHHLPTLKPKSLKTPESQQTLRDLQSDVFLVASYGLILPQGVLDIPAFGCLNIHASLLPKYRGASPIAAAILAGERETGITFMSMDAGCDTGPMLKQVKCPIEINDTRITLEQRLSELAAESTVQALDDWQTKKILPQPQPEEGVTSAPRLTRQDGCAVWDDAAKLERKIRAYQPWPGLWTVWKNTEIKILEAISITGKPTETPGTVVIQESNWVITCANGYLVPKLIQFSGRKPQPAKNIPGSYPDFIGSVLG